MVFSSAVLSVLCASALKIFYPIPGDFTQSEIWRNTTNLAFVLILQAMIQSEDVIFATTGVTLSGGIWFELNSDPSWLLS